MSRQRPRMHSNVGDIRMTSNMEKCPASKVQTEVSLRLCPELLPIAAVLTIARNELPGGQVSASKFKLGYNGPFPNASRFSWPKGE